MEASTRWSMPSRRGVGGGGAASGTGASRLFEEGSTLQQVESSQADAAELVRLLAAAAAHALA